MTEQQRVFKCVSTVDGDALYFGALNLKEAKRQFFETLGYVPKELLVWTEIEQLPDGEEFFA